MKRIFFIATAALVILIVIILFMVFWVFQSQNTAIPPGGTVIPTRVPGSQGGSTERVIAPITYNQQKTDALVEAATNRQALSPSGTAAKAKLVSSLNNASGVVYSVPSVSIEYIKSADLFQGQIRNGNVSQAKQQGSSFMTSQGFTNDDLCKLPFSFYLSPSARNAQPKSAVFNPRPDGC